MNKNKCLAVFVLLPVIFFSSQSMAAGSWWEKAKGLFSESEAVNLPSGLINNIPSALSSSEINDAFKQALRIGSEKVVDRLGVTDGFNTDPLIHIPLPDKLDTVKSVLSSVGMSQLTDDLELRLNRAAELATPVAKAHFLQAISAMTFDDVMAIYQGPEDSATQYFQTQMSESLSSEMRPIIADSLAQVGAIKAFDTALERYQTIPFVPDINANLTDYVLEKGMAGIFYYIAKEEAAIREDPVKQTTALLKKVFGEK